MSEYYRNVRGTFARYRNNFEGETYNIGLYQSSIPQS